MQISMYEITKSHTKYNYICNNISWPSILNIHEWPFMLSSEFSTHGHCFHLPVTSNFYSSTTKCIHCFISHSRLHSPFFPFSSKPRIRYLLSYDLCIFSFVYYLPDYTFYFNSSKNFIVSLDSSKWISSSSIASTITLYVLHSTFFLLPAYIT